MPSLFPSGVPSKIDDEGLGKEKKLRGKIDEVREFAKKIMREKESELWRQSTLESEDLLSNFLRSGQSDEEFVVDVVICFILVGRDTTSAALTSLLK